MCAGVSVAELHSALPVEIVQLTTAKLLYFRHYAVQCRKTEMWEAVWLRGIALCLRYFHRNV